jgi:hypothetical protein
VPPAACRHPVPSGRRSGHLRSVRQLIARCWRSKSTSAGTRAAAGQALPSALELPAQPEIATGAPIVTYEALPRLRRPGQHWCLARHLVPPPGSLPTEEFWCYALPSTTELLIIAVKSP